MRNFRHSDFLLPDLSLDTGDFSFSAFIDAGKQWLSPVQESLGAFFVACFIDGCFLCAPVGSHERRD
jgi:hypothetical protein